MTTGATPTFSRMTRMREWQRERAKFTTLAFRISCSTIPRLPIGSCSMPRSFSTTIRETNQSLKRITKRSKRRVRRKSNGRNTSRNTTEKTSNENKRKRSRKSKAMTI